MNYTVLCLGNFSRLSIDLQNMSEQNHVICTDVVVRNSRVFIYFGYHEFMTEAAINS